MLNDEFSIVLADECMALYKNGELICAAVKLTFYDVLEATGASCDILEGEVDIYNDPLKFPQKLKDVVLDPIAKR